MESDTGSLLFFTHHKPFQNHSAATENMPLFILLYHISKNVVIVLPFIVSWECGQFYMILL